ncbi:MAG: NRDE family protein [Negativicutes bacterium]|nr:NRDE family protein [Negativicutes bacterium]
MCIILFAYDCHPDYWLILLANRDEFYNRLSSPAGFWDDCPQVLGGRDLEQGGSWLGVTKGGRIAAVTNYRDPQQNIPNAVSRGKLISEFLCGDEGPEAYMRRINAEADRYNGFSLLAGEAGRLWYYSNRQRTVAPVAPGIHGLSNHLIDTPWPKVRLGVKRLEEIMQLPPPVWEDACWQLLADKTQPPDADLPATGVSLAWERVLSPIFIESPDYGTRASTLLFIDRRGGVRFCERSRDAVHKLWQRREYQFNWEG